MRRLGSAEAKQLAHRPGIREQWSRGVHHRLTGMPHACIHCLTPRTDFANLPRLTDMQHCFRPRRQNISWLRERGISSFSTGTQSILRLVYQKQCGSCRPGGCGCPKDTLQLLWPEAFRNTEGMEPSLWGKLGVRINKIKQRTCTVILSVPTASEAGKGRHTGITELLPYYSQAQNLSHIR